MSRKITAKQNAEIIYHNILKRNIYPQLGDKTTYLHDLKNIGNRLFGVKFKGVFPSDKIPRLNDLAPYAILNLDRSKEPGSHWVAIAKHGEDTYLYDSFGRDHTEIIKNLSYSGNGRILNTELDAEQKISETDCGARSMAFLVVFDKHGPDVAKYI